MHHFLSSVVTKDIEVATSDVPVVVVVELREGIFNANNEISLSLEDLEAASFLPDHFDCICGCNAFLDFYSAFSWPVLPFLFSFQAFLAFFFLFLPFPSSSFLLFT